MKISYILFATFLLMLFMCYYSENYVNYSYHHPGALGRVNPSLFFDKSLKIDTTYPNKIE